MLTRKAGAETRRHMTGRVMRASTAQLGLMAMLVLAACQTVPMPENPSITDLSAQIVRPREPGPPQGPEGACWEADITPAIIETVTEQVQVTAEERDETGTVITPATFRTETRQSIAREREVVYFRTPCPEELTIEFVGSLQRALKARGIYTGPLTGQIDAPTAEAIRRFQAERGLDSPRLSLGAARELGLSSVPLDQL